MRLPAAIATVFAALTLGAGAQVTVYVPGNIPTVGTCNVIPFGQSASFAPGYSYIGRIPASFLAPALGQQRIQEIYFSPCNSGNWSCATVQMGLGHVPTALPAVFSFPVGGLGSFLDYTVIYDSATQGPYSWNVTANTWSPMGFAAAGGTPFCWNGVNDIAFYVTYQNAVVTGWDGSFHRTGTEPFRAYAGGYNAPASTGNGPNGLIMSFDFGSCGTIVPLYETNNAASSLDFNGVQGTQFSRATTTVCTNTPVNVNISSTQTGLPWEAIYNFSPLVSATTIGSITTGGGQIVNVDLSAGASFFFGGAVPAPIPFPGNFNTAFTSPGSAGVFSIQQANADPTHADGLALSQGCQLVVNAFILGPGPIAGPTLDDSEVVLNVGCMSGLFGRVYNNLYIESNGRMMFGGGNTTFTPSTTQFATDTPSFGVWCDLNPGTGGLITVTQPTPGVVRVDYAAVPYFATTIPITFSLSYDTNNGIATIDGMSGIATSTGQQLIGISGGSVVGATNAGASNYGPPPLFGITANPTDMIYQIGTAGSVAPGVQRIDFIPNASQNYDWLSS